MRLRFMSDLHLEFLCKNKAAANWPKLPKVLRKNIEGWWGFDKSDADWTILAGDIHSHPEYVPELLDQFGKIIYVFGNHEYYRKGVDVKAEREKFKEFLTREGLMENFKFLDDSYFIDQDVMFFGGTLWTDLELNGPEGRDHLLWGGHRMMNDYAGLRSYGLDKFDTPADFRPKHTVEMHKHTLEQLKIARTANPDNKLVVVTHHGPHRNSIHARYKYAEREGAYNPFYISDLTNVIEETKPTLWIHGHVHNSFDYKVGDTRVMTNPRGYPANQAPNVFPNKGSENDKFDPNLVVDI